MENEYAGSLFCPKKEERVFFENCQAICPKEWPINLTISPAGRLRCIFCPKEGKALFDC